MLLTDLFGKPIYCEAGLWGHRNDRGLWALSDIYNNPDAYLSGGETLLMDGVFQGDLHINTTCGAVIPSNKAALACASAEERRLLRAANRKQRHLRVVIEQTLGLICQYKIVGNVLYRGDIEEQGRNFLLCTQLTAHTMRLREKYPRGQKWLDQAGELEEWERLLGESLYADPAMPG